MANLSREELEALDRDTLISQAEAAGVRRARILTRPELVDEILLARAEDRASVKKARGFFGVARDLLIRAVEKGLNLPDAHQRFSPPPPRPRTAGEIVPTVTLAEIFAAQGHTSRAVETLRGVLAREPDHAAAQALLSRLSDEEYAPPPPPALPPEEENVTLEEDGPEGRAAAPRESAHASLEDEEPLTPHRIAPPASSFRGHEEDTCVALPESGALRVGWRLRQRALSHYAARLPEGALALRVVIFTPNAERTRRTMRDVMVFGVSGHTLISGLPEDVVVRVAIGMMRGATFMPIAHSPLVERSANGALFVRTARGEESLAPELAALARPS